MRFFACNIILRGDVMIDLIKLNALADNVNSSIKELNDYIDSFLPTEKAVISGLCAPSHLSTKSVDNPVDDVWNC